LVVYEQATINNNSMVTVAKFKQLVQSIPDDILRYFAYSFLLIDKLISGIFVMLSCTFAKHMIIYDILKEYAKLAA